MKNSLPIPWGKTSQPLLQNQPLPCQLHRPTTRHQKTPQAPPLPPSLLDATLRVLLWMIFTVTIVPRLLDRLDKLVLVTMESFHK
ncbi:MAG: hypothetical protein HC916_17855 [Coleofasciculaceae cyanobacterium SM2_1_6]|nr:hypothetical protein [Coleofasciculaceae cyanobacterium SM2_1_6]